MESSIGETKIFKPDWPSTIFAAILVSILPILLLLYGLTSNNVLISLFSTILIISFFIACIIYKNQTYIRVEQDSVSWKSLMQEKKFFKFSDLTEIIFFTDAPSDYPESFYGVVDLQNNKYSFPTVMGKKDLLNLAKVLKERTSIPITISTIPWWKGPAAVLVFLSILALMCLIVWIFRNL